MPSWAAFPRQVPRGNCIWQMDGRRARARRAAPVDRRAGHARVVLLHQDIDDTRESCVEKAFHSQWFRKHFTAVN